MEEKNLQQQESQETDSSRYKQGAGMEEQGPAGHLHHGRILSGLSVLADVPRDLQDNRKRTDHHDRFFYPVRRDRSGRYPVRPDSRLARRQRSATETAIIKKDWLHASPSSFCISKFLLLLRNLFLLLAQQAVDHRRDRGSRKRSHDEDPHLRQGGSVPDQKSWSKASCRIHRSSGKRNP